MRNAFCMFSLMGESNLLSCLDQLAFMQFPNLHCKAELEYLFLSSTFGFFFGVKASC